MRFTELFENETLFNIDSVIKTLKHEVPISYDNLTKGKVIWRGFPGKFSSDDFVFVDPKRKTRKSANTDNYYTLLMDNLEEWSKFPDRSKSFICSTSIHTASEHGMPKVILPKNDAIIGVSPGVDIWWSFSYLYNITKIKNLDDFNITLNEYARNADVILNDVDFNKFKQGLEQIDQYYFNQNEKNKERFNELYFKEQPLLENIKELLDPEKNDFKAMNLKEFYNSGVLNYDREVWTDSESYILDEMVAEKIAEKHGVSILAY